MNTRNRFTVAFLACMGLGLVLALGLATMFSQVSFSSVNANGADSKGTDFWLAFPPNYVTELTLFITGETTTTGTVSVPGQAWSSGFNVTPGSVTTVTLDVGVQLANPDTVENKGIHVTSDDEVTVYGLNYNGSTTDAYLGLPTDVLGTEYMVLSYYASTGSQFAVVGTESSTTITVTPSFTTGARTAGVAYTVTLTQGQTYLLQNTTGGADLTGSIVTADKPVAVFGSNKCANVPQGYSACDHMVEQLPDVSTWGQNFALVPLATRSGDTIRVLASTDATIVSVNSSVVATLDRGEFYEQIISTTAMITTTAPALVAQYAHSTSYDGAVADPFMMLIPPTEQFLGEYTLATPAAGFTGHYVNIVAPDAVLGQISVDGTLIPAEDYTAIANGFSGVAYTVTLGTHNLAGPLPFGAFSYGFGNYNSYGYAGGGSYAPVGNIAGITLTLDAPSTVIGGQLCMTALVGDQQGSPLASIRVDFAASGANTASGFDFTDAGGEAAFCYTGTNEGQDNVTATAASFHDSDTHTWTASAPPPVPVLRSPTDGSTIYDSMAVTMTWNANTGPDTTGYLLDFNGTVIDVGDAASFGTGILGTGTVVLSSGTYTWTVAAYNSGGQTSAFADPWEFTIARETDLAVSKSYVRSHQAVTFTVTARNLGPSGADGAVVQDVCPDFITNLSWTCVASGDASCGTSGAGNVLSETLTSFPANGVVTFTLVGAISRFDAVSNTVTLTPPADVTDSNEANNSATVHEYRFAFPLVYKEWSLARK